MTEHITPADTAKLIRKALKGQWSGHKFSVRTSVYAGGASIDVRWTDGPSVPEVNKVVQQFKGATFDGMTDMKSYHASELNGREVHFGADFVFCHRKYSDEATMSTIHALALEYCPAEILDLEQMVIDLEAGRLYNVSPMGNYDGSPYWSWQNLIQNGRDKAIIVNGSALLSEV